MQKIYFDHSATTPVDPRIVDAMIPFLSEKFGNASSIHSYGREAKVALEEAREFIADFCGAHANEIYFTSGGTEADNMAILGVARQLAEKGKHIITSAMEHHAVLHTCEYLQKQGFEVTYLKPDQYGEIHPEAVAEAIRENTILISIMHANNEVGTINSIEKIGEIAYEKKVLFHTDAVQSFGKLPIDLSKLNVDLMSMSGHKIYGPKGVGILFVKKGVRLQQTSFGGAHERNKRPGTENITGIIGLAKAVEICKNNLESDEDKIGKFRDLLLKKINENIPRVYLNGHPNKRSAGLLNLSFQGIEGEALLLSLDLKGVAASSGSACTSGSVEPSHVLSAMGVKPELAQSSIRFSLGRGNTIEDVEYTVEILVEIVERLRAMSPL
ncbi:cysteine desulfurase NifS [candidate division KSB1 bacterium]|nr:cysteine desulfurase NifS [candidate division KSB1 bacterium]MBL7094034.1 cysteine desulfurase NifS [candidate division KSB1 bacterium]